MRIVAGVYKNQKIFTPKGLVTRPSAEQLRESFFNICQTYIQDCSFLDLFAGSGAMGLEALSRGASRATFVDTHRDSIQCIRRNVNALHVEEKAQIWQGDVFRKLHFFAKQGIQFDLIFADPPYETFQGPHLLSHLLVQTIDKYSLLNPAGNLFVEESNTIQPYSSDLVHLTLVDCRRTGKAHLFQYKLI